MITDAFYLIVLLAVAFVAVGIGFRQGITRQISSILGMGFGAVASRVFTPEFSSWFEWTERIGQAPEFNEFTANLVCGVTIYCVVYWLFSLFGGILRSAMSVFEVGMFNRLLGAFFSLMKNMLWLSIVFNLLLCLSPESGLMRYERSNDGNPVAAVMAMTPAIIGCYGADDFAHFHQLKEAKSISENLYNGYRNIHSTENVVIVRDFI